jgi:hypothetical protein
MGEVFRAVAVGESGFEKPVVVKRILPAHLGRTDLAELFIAEAKLMTRLAHPNIVEVLDFGRGEGGDYFLVLELVDGVDLARLHRASTARGERLPIPLALFVVTQVLRGLHHAHAKSGGEGAWLVHRDVSPGNVLLSTVGEVKVADFGVALIARPSGGEGGDGGDGGEGAERGPLAKGLVGKPQYMAPEQYDGADVDPRADLFSVGVMLFFLLTDAFPFEGATLAEQQDAAHRGDFGRARDRRGEVSAEIDAVLRRALAPLPRDRFADAKAMAQAIEGLRAHGQAIANEDDVAAAVEAAQRAQPKPGRRVIALSGPSLAELDDASLAEQELTRTGGPGGVGSFTIRVADGEAGPTLDEARPLRLEVQPTLTEPGEPPPRASKTEPAPAPSRAPAAIAPTIDDGSDAPRIPLNPGLFSGRALAIGALALAILAGLGLGFRRHAVRARLRALEAAAAGEPPPIERSGRRRGAPDDPPTIATAPTRASAEPTTAPSPSPTRSIAPRPSVTATAAPSIAPPADGCTGGVRIASTGSWTVSGGPQSVQSPGVYTWRCGTFALSATSRADATQHKQASVTVRSGGTALVDLR